MHAKSLVFGLGTGIIICSVVLFLIYSFDLKKTAADSASAVAGESPKPSPLTDTEVAELAAKIGMVFPTAQQPVALTSEEIIQQAERLGMVFPAAEPDVKPVTEPVVEPVVEATPEPTPRPKPTPTPIPDQKFPDRTIVTILSGSGAWAVAEKFYKLGIVENSEDFLNYLINQSATKKIMSGTYTIPVGATYEDIINMIKR